MLCRGQRWLRRCQFNSTNRGISHSVTASPFLDKLLPWTVSLCLWIVHELLTSTFQHICCTSIASIILCAAITKLSIWALLHRLERSSFCRIPDILSSRCDRGRAILCNDRLRWRSKHLFLRSVPIICNCCKGMLLDLVRFALRRGMTRSQGISGLQDLAVLLFQLLLSISYRCDGHVFSALWKAYMCTANSDSRDLWTTKDFLWQLRTYIFWDLSVVSIVVLAAALTHVLQGFLRILIKSHAMLKLLVSFNYILSYANFSSCSQRSFVCRQVSLMVALSFQTIKKCRLN